MGYYGTDITEAEALLAAMGDTIEDHERLEDMLAAMHLPRIRALRDGASKLMRCIDAERGRRASGQPEPAARRTPRSTSSKQ